MKLDTTTRKLQVLLDATVSTTACDVIVCYRDENRNAPQSLGAVPSATYLSTVSSATVVDMLPAPSVNTVVRVPERIAFKNRDTTTRIPTFRLNDNATTYQFVSPTLLTGESFFYDEHQGWYAVDANGNRKSSIAIIPNSPLFLAYNSATDTNVTGAGTVATIDFDTVVYDVTGNFASDTFTAPITGKYLLCAQSRIEDLTAAMTVKILTLVTSNRSYAQYDLDVPAAGDRKSMSISQVCDMDAADTATVTWTVSNGVGDTADITGASLLYTCFSGVRVG